MFFGITLFILCILLIILIVVRNIKNSNESFYQYNGNVKRLNSETKSKCDYDNDFISQEQNTDFEKISYLFNKLGVKPKEFTKVHFGTQKYKNGFKSKGQVKIKTFSETNKDLSKKSNSPKNLHIEFIENNRKDKDTLHNHQIISDLVFSENKAENGNIVITNRNNLGSFSFWTLDKINKNFLRLKSIKNYSEALAEENSVIILNIYFYKKNIRIIEKMIIPGEDKLAKKCVLKIDY